MLKEHSILTHPLAISLDLATVVFSFVVAYFLRAAILEWIPFGAPASLGDYPGLMVTIVLLWWAILYLQRAYRPQGFMSLSREYKVVLRVTACGMALVLTGAFLLKAYFPRSLVLLFALVSACLLASERTIVYYAIQRMRRNGRHRKSILIVGTGQIAQVFLDSVHRHTDWGLDVVGVLDENPEKVGASVGGSAKSRVLGTFQDMAQVLHKHAVDEVAFALPTEKLGEVRNLLDVCEREGVQARLISDFFRTSIGRVQAEQIDGISMLTFSTTPAQEWPLFIKRLIDVVASSVLLVLLAPLFLLIALLVKITSSGEPVFYRWRVVGRNKKPFIGYKFRTMVTNADQLKEKLLAVNEMNGPVFKLGKDPRVTPAGRILRKFSLDELPQLWSVLKGDMSLVGPRPPLETELPKFENWHRRKLSVTPGLTCLWQVNGRNKIEDFDEWVRLDLEYIDNWSLGLDFRILLKTIPVVLIGRGAH